MIFSTLQFIFDTLGLTSSPEKDSPPAFEMVSLGILVNSKDFTLRVPESRLREYPMSYICGCHASALPSKNCSLCSVNFLSCLLASTLVGFFFLALERFA